MKRTTLTAVSLVTAFVLACADSDSSDEPIAQHDWMVVDWYGTDYPNSTGFYESDAHYGEIWFLFDELEDGLPAGEETWYEEYVSGSGSDCVSGFASYDEGGLMATPLETGADGVATYTVDHEVIGELVCSVDGDWMTCSGPGGDIIFTGEDRYAEDAYDLRGGEDCD